jgi:4'-phosphopantetheinyl transferase
VWCTSLAVSDGQVQRLRQWLSPDELERADRMRLEHLRDRFVVSRGRQREILAAYLSQPPDQLQFEYGDVGKPRLAAPSTPGTLQFNLSNSHEVALLAISRGRELGVDIEYLDRRTNNESIARRYFADSEKRALAALPPSERREAFFRCWTRKEAVLKGLGVGLTFPLDRVEVPVHADASGGVLALDERLGRADVWTLAHLTPADKYVAALAFQNGPARMSHFAWAPHGGAV